MTFPPGVSPPCQTYKLCYKHAKVMPMPLGCIAPDEFFALLEMTLRKESAIDRLVFWDLTQLEHRAPLLVNDRMFLPTLMDYLKNYKFEGKKRPITSVFMGAPNMAVAHAAADMADNVVFCWRDQIRSEEALKDRTETFGALKLQPKTEGVVFYADRIQGLPGEHTLFMLEDGAGHKGNPPKVDINELLHRVREQHLVEASEYMKLTEELQGFPGSANALKSYTPRRAGR